MSLSRRELEELKPMIDKAVQVFLGFSEPTLVTVAINCVDKGYDQRKTADKLLSYLDERQAKTFTEKLFATYSEFRSLGKQGRNRKRKDDRYEDGVVDSKKQKKTEESAPAAPVPEPGNPSPGQLTTDKIKEMMANAQRMISERKAQLGVPEHPVPPPVPANDLLRRQQELQARIQSQMMNAGLDGDSVAAALAAVAQKQAQAQQSKPTPLILDEQGRTIDAKTGETIQLQQHMPTLKANIRAKRREQFKAVQEKAPEEISESRFFDPRVAAKGAMRSKRGFRFHDKGKFEGLAAKLRTKAQLEKLQNEIAQAAKKTGIASAAKLATIQPKKDLIDGDIPNVEWWDGVILQADSYDSYFSEGKKGTDRFEGITNLIEHPIQMRAPAEPTKTPTIGVVLTKKERKKLRRQNRLETQKELQEKIRLGLIPPPEPKVRMANLMRVLGTEAVQDPTKIEQHVREQMAKRQKAHEDANAERKLSKDQRREKKIKKLQEDTSLGIKVSLYRVRDLQDQSKKFKVETNAKQLYMTGIVILHKDCNVIVVEGGPKQQKKFHRLMMHRIKWHEDNKKSTKKDEDEDSDEEEVQGNKCTLVWEGEVKNRAFGEMKFKACPTESFAREQFKKCGVEHYWDLAYSGAILEAAGEEL